MPRASERDWSDLRKTEWQPVASHAKDKAATGASDTTSGGGGSSSSCGGGNSTNNGGGSSKNHGDKSAKEDASGSWRTDAEISAKRWDAKSQGRELKRWEVKEHGKHDAQDDSWGSLEDTTTAKSTKGWDQFRVNEELFGIVSTYKSDLSQYTTPLDPSRVPAELRKRAERIANEIDRGFSSKADDVGGCYSDAEGEEPDEEALFSSVPRSRGGKNGWTTAADAWGAGYDEGWGEDEGWGAAEASNWDGGRPAKGAKGAKGAKAAAGGGSNGAAGAIMALIAQPTGAAHVGDGSWRDRVAPKVRTWWHARRLSGATVPTGAEDALVCPFSERIFGDFTQLVGHWAAAVPGSIGNEGDTSTPSKTTTEQFRRAAKELIWSKMVSESGLDEVFKIKGAKDGSVWEKVLDSVKMRVKSSSGGGALDAQLVSEFVVAVVGMKCWRRDQKVEHREILEAVAAGLALQILSDNPGSRLVPWDASGDKPSSPGDVAGS